MTSIAIHYQEMITVNLQILLKVYFLTSHFDPLINKVTRIIDTVYFIIVRTFNYINCVLQIAAMGIAPKFKHRVSCIIFV